MTIGERIRALRKQKKLSSKELATVIGVTPAYLSMLEKGKRTNPTKEVLQKIANTLEIPLDELFREEQTTENNEVKFTEEEFLNGLTDDNRLLFNKVKNLNPKDVKKILEIIKIFENENSD